MKSHLTLKLPLAIIAISVLMLYSTPCFAPATGHTGKAFHTGNVESPIFEKGAEPESHGSSHTPTTETFPSPAIKSIAAEGAHHPREVAFEPNVRPPSSRPPTSSEEQFSNTVKSPEVVTITRTPTVLTEVTHSTSEGHTEPSVMTVGESQSLTKLTEPARATPNLSVADVGLPHETVSDEFVEDLVH